MKKHIVILLLLSTLLSPCSAWSGAKEFIPRYVDITGALGVGSLYEKNTIKGKRADSSRSDLTIQEGLSLDGLGYIYSPLFVSMKTSLGFGLQHDRETSDTREYRADSDATQFRHEFKILPSHPYNMELYFSRTTPMTAGGGADGNSVVIYEHGARAIYDKRPWATTLTYINHETTGNTTSLNESVRYNLNYFQTGTNVAGAYGHMRGVTANGNSTTTRDLYNFNFNKEFEKIRFSGRWSHDEQDGDDNFFADENKSFTYQIETDELYGDLRIDLPKNFDTLFAYRLSDKYSLHLRETGINTSLSTNENYDFRLHHQLYKSLNSSFSAGLHTNESNGGDMTQESYRLSLDYSKKIPWGNVLTGVSDDISFINNNGAPTALFQTTTTDLNNFIYLDYQNIDLNSFEIYVVDPDPANNGRLILLTEGVDFFLFPYNNSYRIQINNAMPPNLSFHPDGNPYPSGYSFIVNFSFTAAVYDLRTENIGYKLQVALFDNLITPYYSYLQSDQKVTGGIYPGEPSNSKTHSLGMGFSKAPFKGDLSRSWVRSNTTSEDRLATSVTYSKPITPYTSGFLSLSYEDVTTKQNETGTNRTLETLSEQFYTAQAQIQTILPEKNLNASLTTNYSLYQGVGDSTNIALYATLVWHVGRIDLNLTSSYSNSVSTIGANTTSRDYTMVKFMIKRELF